jgi:hypothetical protein
VALSAVAVGATALQAAPASHKTERHRFMMSLSWTTETTWNYSYTERETGGCHTGEDLVQSAAGAGRETWRLTSRRPTLFYVDFYSGPGTASYRGRPPTGGLHKVDVVHDLNGSFVRQTRCGARVSYEDRWPTGDCGARRFPLFTRARANIPRRNRLGINVVGGGNRAYRATKGRPDCPGPPGEDRQNLWDARPPIPQAELLTIFVRHPGGFDVPFRWERLKKVKRLTTPLRYVKTVKYRPASPSRRQGVVVTQTGAIRTEIVGKWTLKRIGRPPRR